LHRRLDRSFDWGFSKPSLHGYLFRYALQYLQGRQRNG
jgi:hypothetical protein